MEIDKLVIELPGRDEKGFLRRTRKALEFKEMLEEKSVEEIGSDMVDTLLDFVMEYVKQPVDKHAARELLLDASEKQFYDIVAALSAGNTNPTLPQSSENDSAIGTEESESKLAGV